METNASEPMEIHPTDLDPKRPDIATTMQNISLANGYRSELIKQLLTVSTALFAFTIAFYLPQPGTTAPTVPTAATWLAWLGWLFLGVAILCGLVQIGAWESFYISYRDYDNRSKFAEGRQRRKRITLIRSIAMYGQYVTFVLGVVCVGLFAALRFVR